jgi:hypothetical protein
MGVGKDFNSKKIKNETVTSVDNYNSGIGVGLIF